MTMNVQQIRLERVEFESVKPFDEVIGIVDEAIGHPDMRILTERLTTADTYAEFERAVKSAVGKADLLEFLRLDLGRALWIDPEIKPYRLVRIIAGNPLIMKEMTRHVPDAGSYAPVTLLIYE